MFSYLNISRYKIYLGLLSSKVSWFVFYFTFCNFFLFLGWKDGEEREIYLVISIRWVWMSRRLVSSCQTGHKISSWLSSVNKLEILLSTLYVASMIRYHFISSLRWTSNHSDIF